MFFSIEGAGSDGTGELTIWASSSASEEEWMNGEFKAKNGD
jgi:hypothetical protein